MEMKKLMAIAMVFSALILLAGCGQVRTEAVNAHEGTEGLAISFLERSPPDEVYVNEVFPVTLEIANKGAYEIEDGLLVIGVERDYVDVMSDEYEDKAARFSLAGRSSYDPRGGLERKTIELRARDLDPQSETHTTIVALTACYPYKTEATASVCVDTDYLGQRQEEKVCIPSTIDMGTSTRDGQDLPKGQGAPIAITKIEQKMLPHEREGFVKPMYMIYVRNMGDGLPVDIDVYDKACESTGISKGTLNVMQARVYLSDRSVELNCSPKLASASLDKAGYLKLEKKEDFIKCTLEEGIPQSMGIYTTPLMIDMEYGYTFTISKTVLIRKQV